MQKRKAATRTVRWALFLGTLLIAALIWRLFWIDATDGRTGREVERIENAQDRIVEGAPTVPAPAAPSQD